MSFHLHRAARLSLLAAIALASIAQASPPAPARPVAGRMSAERFMRSPVAGERSTAAVGRCHVVCTPAYGCQYQCYPE